MIALNSIGIICLFQDFLDILLNMSRVLIAGHSFIRRIRNDRINFEFPRSLIDSIDYICGPTCDELERELKSCMRVGKYDVAYVEIGSNDICAVSCTAEMLCSKICAIAELLVNRFGVKGVIVGWLKPRHDPAMKRLRSDYCALGMRTNELLKVQLNGNTKIIFWEGDNKGKLKNRKFYGKDGVHLNELGTKAFVRQIRGALLHALRRI